MDDLRARYATEVFLATMRREWLAENVGSESECPVKRFDDYQKAHMGALTRALRAAVHSASDKQTPSFERFLERLREKQQ